jgi:hypothetical protein
MYSELTFTFTVLEHAHTFLVTKRTPAVDEMRSLQCSFMLPPGRAPFDWRNSDFPGEAWRRTVENLADLRRSLGTMPRLRQASIWLDAVDNRYRTLMLTSPMLFDFDSRVASVLTIILPSHADELAAELYSMPHPFTIIQRSPHPPPPATQPPAPDPNQPNAFHRMFIV